MSALPTFSFLLLIPFLKLSVHQGILFLPVRTLKPGCTSSDVPVVWGGSQSKTGTATSKEDDQHAGNLKISVFIIII